MTELKSRDEIIEAMARAIQEGDGMPRAMAICHATAALACLDSLGVELVPREATGTMLKDGAMQNAQYLADLAQEDGFVDRGGLK